MNVKEIIVAALEEMDCDGLCNMDLECGCWLPDDFLLCDYISQDCVAAYRMTQAQAQAAGVECDPNSDFVMLPASEWERCAHRSVLLGSPNPEAHCHDCHGAGFARKEKP